MARKSGNIDLVRADSPVATLIQPGQPERRIGLQRRGIAECLAEELRRLETDAVYEAALTRGLTALAHTRSKTASTAIAEGEAPSIAQAKRRTALAERSASKTSAAARQAKPSAKKTATKQGPARSPAKTAAKAPAKKATKKSSGR